MTEIWKAIIGSEGSYEVSDQGRVRSLARTIIRRYRDGFRHQPVKPAILKATLNSAGYLTVTVLGRKTKAVHSLVLEAFAGPRPDGFEGLHRDGDKLNNKLSNLRWGTSEENKSDAIEHGVWTHGEMVGCAKLTEADVAEIRRTRKTLKFFANLYGVTQTAVSYARRRKTWRHLP